jgi:hypothetical protein
VVDRVSPVIANVEVSPSATTPVPAASGTAVGLASNWMVDNTNSAPSGISPSIPVPVAPLVWIALAASVWIFALRPSRTGLRNRSVSTT